MATIRNDDPRRSSIRHQYTTHAEAPRVTECTTVLSMQATRYVSSRWLGGSRGKVSDGNPCRRMSLEGTTCARLLSTLKVIASRSTTEHSCKSGAARERERERGGAARAVAQTLVRHLPEVSSQLVVSDDGCAPSGVVYHHTFLVASSGPRSVVLREGRCASSEGETI